MKIKVENIVEKNLAVRLFVAYVGTALFLMFYGLFGQLPWEPFFCAAGVLSLMALAKAVQAFKRIALVFKVLGVGKAWCTCEEVFVRFSRSARESAKYWFGTGFEWTQIQAQQFYGMQKANWKDFYHQLCSRLAWLYFFWQRPAFCFTHPLQAYKHYRQYRASLTSRKGLPWLRCMGKEVDFQEQMSTMEGHVLVCGSTGTGKTRIFSAAAVQAVFAGDAVIVVDPKGDAQLKAAIVEACRLSGRPQDFIEFDISFPERSIQMDPLASFSRPGELAVRIGNTIPTEGNNGPFVEFGVSSLATVFEAMVRNGEKPTIQSGYRHLLNRQAFARQALEKHIESKFGAESVREALKNGGSQMTDFEKLRKHYEQNCVTDTGIEAVIALAEHDDSHFSKMIPAMLQQLKRLSEGSIGELLSPKSDSQAFWDIKKVIARKKVLYVSLSAMQDHSSAIAVGSMILADFAAVTGQIQSYSVGALQPVTVFVDEAGEMISEPFIQVLNKGRSVGANLFVATQTLADFTSRSAKPSDALRILANLNHFFAFRCNDPETLQFLSERMGAAVIEVVSRAHAVSVRSDSAFAQNGNLAERVLEKEVQLVSPAAIAGLADCEYFACIAGGKVVKGRIPVIVKTKDEYKGVL